MFIKDRDLHTEKCDMQERERRREENGGFPEITGAVSFKAAELWKEDQAADQAMWKRANEETKGCDCYVMCWHYATVCLFDTPCWQKLCWKKDFTKSWLRHIKQVWKISLLWLTNRKFLPDLTTSVSSEKQAVALSGSLRCFPTTIGQIDNKNGTTRVPMGSATSQEKW